VKLSSNFSLDELTHSDYASRHGLENKPDAKSLENLKRLADLLEQVRTVCGTPIVVSSGYRSPSVNAGIGGSKASQHMFGCAADIRALRMSIDDLMKKVVGSDIKYDQIIKEFNSWVHISVPNSPTATPRKQALIIDQAGTRIYR
jgi:zinc D-Ala-D-Ala carboxypeptidase